jgi:hypothetical protein
LVRHQQERVDYGTDRVTVNLSPNFSCTLLFDGWKIFWGKNTMTDSKASLRKKDERKRKDAQRKRDERSTAEGKERNRQRARASRAKKAREEARSRIVTHMREYNWALFPDEGGVASLPSVVRLTEAFHSLIQIAQPHINGYISAMDFLAEEGNQGRAGSKDIRKARTKMKRHKSAALEYFAACSVLNIEFHSPDGNFFGDIRGWLVLWDDADEEPETQQAPSNSKRISDIARRIDDIKRKMKLSEAEKIEIEEKLTENLVFLYGQFGLENLPVVKGVSLIACGMVKQQFHEDCDEMPGAGEAAGSMTLLLDKCESTLDFEDQEVSLVPGMICVFTGDKRHRGACHRTRPAIRMHVHYGPAEQGARFNQVKLANK